MDALLDLICLILFVIAFNQHLKIKDLQKELGEANALVQEHLP